MSMSNIQTFNTVIRYQFESACDTLRAAHGKKIFHGDLHNLPNTLIDEVKDSVVLIDWGEYHEAGETNHYMENCDKEELLRAFVRQCKNEDRQKIGQLNLPGLQDTLRWVYPDGL